MGSLATFRSAGWGRLTLAVAVASLLTGVLATPAIARRQSPANDTEPPTFDWSSINPSADLAWVDCYTPPLKCARLSVPMNYSDPEGDFGAVALISNPSPMADTPSYRGPILINPGGPGGSGVEFVRVLGDDLLRPLFGDEFDIVGFDPRAVGGTTPKPNYTTIPEEQLVFGRKFNELGDLSEESWPTLPERAEELREYAEESLLLRGDVLRYSVTENVARDMLSIVEAHGREKLQYYGISYGSVLGSVFSTLFPDKVERIIIDGVVEQAGYFNDDWSRSVLDTEKTLAWFLSSCVDAGPELCAFHANTTDAIWARYEAVEDLIRTETLFYPDADDRVFEYSHFQLLVFNIIYAITNFAALAEALAGIEQGVLPFTTGTIDSAGWSLSQTAGLICSDTRLTHRTPLEMREYAIKVRNITEHLPVLVASNGAWCSGWLIESDHFRGPMGANTSFPLLMVGNTADTITPLVAAHENSIRFPGSRVLTYNVPGHATVTYPGNECVAAHFRAYMLDGTLPDEGAVCEETRPFYTAAEDGPGASLRSTRKLNTMRRTLFKWGINGGLISR